MKDTLVYLDTYTLQLDMRIRLPKSILANLGVEKGKSRFDVFIDHEQKCLVLRAAESKDAACEAAIKG